MMKPLIFCPVLLIAFSAFGGYQNTTLNISANGGRMQGAQYISIGSLVPVAGATTFSPRYANHSGFAAGFILRPGTAFSGLADEWNPDNDLDGLVDADEITAGSDLYNPDSDADGLNDAEEVHLYGTSPVLSDTDSDGMDDHSERIAGTSATDAASLFVIACELDPSGNRILSWHGVSGRLYTFEYSSILNTNQWESFPFDVSGFDETISFLDESMQDSRFYRVKVRRSE